MGKTRTVQFTGMAGCMVQERELVPLIVAWLWPDTATALTDSFPERVTCRCSCWQLVVLVAHASVLPYFNMYLLGITLPCHTFKIEVLDNAQELSLVERISVYSCR